MPLDDLLTQHGCKFKFSPKFVLSNLNRIRQVAAQVRLLSQVCFIELLTHSLGCGAVARNPCVSWAFLLSSWQNFWNGNEFRIFFIWVTLIKIANTPLDRSVALVLSITNLMYCRYTSIRQIWLEFWMEPDLSEFRIWWSQRRNPVEPYIDITSMSYWYHTLDRHRVSVRVVWALTGTVSVLELCERWQAPCQC